MAPAEPTPIADLSEIRFRTDTIGAASRLAFVVFGAGLIYSLTTWESPHRTAIVILFGALLASTVILLRVPVQPTADRRRDPFFLVWSTVSILITGALAALDGGVHSPLALLFFVPIVFAALSYPLPLVVAISALSELIFVAVGTFFGAPDPIRVAFFAACLALTAVLCALQAQNHDRRRAELALTSRVDPLTGALNRRGFEERMAAELDRGVRTGRPLSLVMLDLDRFKEINDSEGHAAGDELLRWTVQTLREALRPMDSIGRMGGDEFALLFPGAAEADAVASIVRMRAVLSARVTAAAGVASFPGDGIDWEELLKHADDMLYEAKRGATEILAPGRRELSWAAALARAVDLRTAGSGIHSSRVAHIASAIGEELGWSRSDVGRLRMAAMLHDVGKVTVPDNVLRKRGPLTEEEYAEIKKHPATGADLLARVDGLDPILPWIRHSHEHFDGSGYPDGLSGEAIPPASRILLVADALDALTTSRPYRDGVSEEAALAELRLCVGRQFDPRCVDALEQYLTKLRTASEFLDDLPSGAAAPARGEGIDAS